VESWPILRPGHQAFLATLGEDIAEASHLSFLLLRDRDSAISALPELALPSMEGADLPGDVGIDKAHKDGQLLGVFHLNQEI
jgi:hypothetical protein